MQIQIGSGEDSDLEYEILCINEFSSERKIMSVVVKEKLTERYFCFAKGAESQIFASLSSESAESALKKKVEAETFNFGSKGLRTLVFAMREMTNQEVDSIDWNSSNTKKLSQACEQNLTVLGCTGALDELQENVQECIQDFKDAGIKFWMLTGD